LSTFSPIFSFESGKDTSKRKKEANPQVDIRRLQTAAFGRKKPRQIRQSVKMSSIEIYIKEFNFYYKLQKVSSERKIHVKRVINGVLRDKSGGTGGRQISRATASLAPPVAFSKVAARRRSHRRLVPCWLNGRRSASVGLCSLTRV
jgi:hypothetical protein